MILKRMNRFALAKARQMARENLEAERLGRFESQIEALRQGKRKAVDAPLLMALAKALNYSVGAVAGKAVSYGLRNRSAHIFGYVQRFIEDGSTVLDLGCGDGKVGELLCASRGCKMTLMDIVDYNKTDLHFVKYNGRNIHFPDNCFDQVLLLTVLHHSDDPIRVMSEALRVANKSVIIIESVYFNELHKSLNKFFDWFYNRVLNNPRINVPFNFLTPDSWVGLFEKLGGKVTHMEHLGIDEPLVPEWHVLYVVKKQY